MGRRPIAPRDRSRRVRRPMDNVRLAIAERASGSGQGGPTGTESCNTLSVLVFLHAVALPSRTARLASRGQSLLRQASQRVVGCA
jgi:hypothetical protein